MKVFSVVGYSDSGKTKTVENIIKELKRRRYSVGTVKEIHCNDFSLDEEGTDTYRHIIAGSQRVTARGNDETGIIFKKKLSIDEILKNYDHDFVILEGVEDSNIPKIITAIDQEGIEGKLDQLAFVISGVISNEISEYEDLPIINSMDNIKELVDLIENKVYRKLPDFPDECCMDCGYTCRELGGRILKGLSKREDCTLDGARVKLKIDGREIDMVPFVQDILSNSVKAVVKELDGYQDGKKIEISIE